MESDNAGGHAPGGGYWEVEVSPREGQPDPRGSGVLGRSREVLGARAEALRMEGVQVSDLFFLGGPGLSRSAIERAGRLVFSDPVTQSFRIREMPAEGAPGDPGVLRATVLKKPGVMDPVEGSLIQALDDLGFPPAAVRTGTRYAIRTGGDLDPAGRKLLAEKVLSNPAIEDVFWSTGGAPVAPFTSARPYRFQLRTLPLEGLSDDALLRSSREGQLSLDLAEMRAIRDHFASLGRAPTDAELETLAQTWSEHCCHKTFTGIIEHERIEPDGSRKVERIDSLLRTMIRSATEEIAAPWCLSVFSDNAGVIAFDDEYGVSFKVETHNHPSAIEPYGGAGTGIGGVLRDTMGTGLGAKPVVSTDVFCFGPPDLPPDDVPPGALHPLRALRGVVAGVRDYGNRMGIPTASGAVFFDRRYIANPLVFCGSVGIIPRERLEKRVEPGDRIYVLGGRTGRDGIHGATFSSVELSEASETVSSGAVQIGNAITEKKLLDVLLEARDRRLFRAVTDCGAGGLSSAVGEMGAATGARVELHRVPLKYEGLAYWEIWISEAQERMVLAVPPDRAPALEDLARREDVECTDIGEFTGTGRLVLVYADPSAGATGRGSGEVVCDLDMRFIHEGRPRGVRRSIHRAAPPRPARWAAPPSIGKALRAILASPNVASKEWIIRQYDHEVQGGSALKPLQGVEEDGPGDGVAFAPRHGSARAIVIGCGMNPLLGDLDPYRMALSAVDEAVRNITAAGGDPERTAILDNFCWGNTERPETLGSLVEAARGCRDAAVLLGTPFISGKDSLNNEYRLGEEIISIPPTLLISSLSVVDDAGRLVSMDLKAPGNRLILVGLTRPELGGSHFLLVTGGEGGEAPGLDPHLAPRIHRAVRRVIAAGLALSCHDLSEGGLGVAAAEMAFAGGIGAEIRLQSVPREGSERDEEVLFSESNSRYLIEVSPERTGEVLALLDGVPAADVGETVKYGILRVIGLDGTTAAAESLEELKDAWKSTLDLDRPFRAAPGAGRRSVR
jgi:phosphoribosylformylglycinamidine synthase II